MNTNLRLLRIFFFTLFVLALTACATEPPRDFSIEGNSVRNAVVAKVKGENLLYISELDGAISCYTVNGQKLWRNETQNPAVMFEINAADIDQDGNEDVLAASGDGTLYAWGSDGQLLWKFHPQPRIRLSEVATIGKGDKMRIFTGGNNYILYELNNKGEKLSETPIKGVIRKLESGNFIDANKEVLFLFTLKHDKYSSEFFGFIDPSTKEIIKSCAFKDVFKDQMMVQDVSEADLDKNGKADLLFFGAGQHAVFFALDGNLKVIANFTGLAKDKQRYAYGFGTSLSPVKDEIVMQRGGILYVLDNKGKLLHHSGVPYRGIIYNDLICEPKSHSLIGLGQIGGDNSLYFYNLDQEKWYEEQHQIRGRQKEVEDNVNTLYQQSLAFKLPAYQKKKEKAFNMIIGGTQTEANSKLHINWMTDDLKKLDGGNVNFITEYILSENTDRSALVKKIGKTALKKDHRKPYNMTRKEIVNWAKAQEKANNPFSLWVGHGSDPFFVQLETIEQIIKVAPRTCNGFLYAEMANTADPRVIYFVRTCVPRIAKAIRKYKSHAKLYFRYKNMFWGADCHTKLWREMFFSNKYNDILVPAAEDTNNRLQDLNFTGRVGMWASGYVKDYAMRLIDDNATSWRPLSPGAQRSISPYLRNGALIAAYGGRYGINFNINYIEKPGFYVLYSLMKSGLIPVVEPKDILSISAWHGIKDIDQTYLEKCNNGHDLEKYSPDDDKNVVGNAGVQWCGAPVSDHDYSKIALGVDYRWLNFLPKTPHGMVPITDVDCFPKLQKAGAETFVSDICHGYIKGKKVSGEDFAKIMKTAVDKGAKKLLMTVDGAAWSLLRIDQKHARLVLVDPGYIDPQERQVTIHFQNKAPLNARNILTKEDLALNGMNAIKVRVPAGSMSFIDFEYAKID